VNVEVERQRLSRTLRMIARERSPFGNKRHLSDVANYIEAEFAGNGVDVERDGFSYAGEKFHKSLRACARGEAIR
jgi:hypothetical protein